MLLHLLVKNDYQIYSELMELSQFEIVHIKKSPIIFHVVTQIEKLDIEKKHNKLPIWICVFCVRYAND